MQDRQKFLLQHVPFLAEPVVTVEMFNQKFYKLKHIKSCGTEIHFFGLTGSVLITYNANCFIQEHEVGVGVWLLRHAE